MQRRIHVFGGGLAMLLVASGLLPSTMEAQTERIQFSYEMASVKLSLHEPVIVTLTIQNLGPEPLRAAFGSDFRSNFAIAITTPDGTTIAPPPVLDCGDAPDCLSATGRALIQPGERYALPLLLNLWYPFDQPGRYRVDIHLTPPLTTEPVEGANVHGTQAGQEVPVPIRGTLNLSVGPRDPARLAAAYENLVSTIERQARGRAAEHAARALSYSRDALVVPYIERTLSMPRDSFVDKHLLPGLVRMGTPEARAVLMDQTLNEDNDRRVSALQALRHFDHRLGR